MAGRVGKDAEAGFPFSRKSSGTKRQDGTLGCVDVVNADVEMQLLGVFGIRPAWRNPGRRPLERELPCARLKPDDDPVIAVLVDAHAKNLRIEPREGSRIRAVQHGLLQPTDHACIMTPYGTDCSLARRARRPYQEVGCCYHIAGTIGSLSVPTMRLKTYSGRRSWWEPFETSAEPVDRS